MSGGSLRHLGSQRLYICCRGRTLLLIMLCCRHLASRFDSSLLKLFTVLLRLIAECCCMCFALFTLLTSTASLQFGQSAEVCISFLTGS